MPRLLRFDRRDAATFIIAFSHEIGSLSRGGPLFARPDSLYRETGLPDQWNETIIPAPLARYSVAGTIGSDIGSEWKCRQHIWPYAHCAHMRSRWSLLRNRQPPNWSDHTRRSAYRWSPYSRFYFRDPAISIPPTQQYRTATASSSINLTEILTFIN